LFIQFNYLQFNVPVIESRGSNKGRIPDSGNQYGGSETFYYGSGSDFSMIFGSEYDFLMSFGSRSGFSMSFGSGSNFQQFPDLFSNPTFFLKIYEFEGSKIAF
jgi:hypothetical protein